MSVAQMKSVIYGLAAGLAGGVPHVAPVVLAAVILDPPVILDPAGLAGL
jgi:hypothetical protein